MSGTPVNRPQLQRRTKQADSLIAGAYLAGTNTRRVRRALSAVFGGAVSKDTVSRVWRKVKGDWDAWNARSLGGEPIVRLILDDLVKRGLRKPEFLIVDGGTGLEQALAALWGDVPTQRCTVHKHRNLLAHAPQRLHDEVSPDYNDMIYATSPAEIEDRRRARADRLRIRSPELSALTARKPPPSG
jgi:transposase-like protein